MENRLKCLPAEVIDRLLPQRREKKEKEEFLSACEELSRELFNKIHRIKGFLPQASSSQRIGVFVEGKVPGNTSDSFIYLATDSNLYVNSGIPRLQFDKYLIEACMTENPVKKEQFINLARSGRQEDDRREGNRLKLQYNNDLIPPIWHTWEITTQQRRLRRFGDGSSRIPPFENEEYHYDSAFVKAWTASVKTWQPSAIQL